MAHLPRPDRWANPYPEADMRDEPNQPDPDQPDQDDEHDDERGAPPAQPKPAG